MMQQAMVYAIAVAAVLGVAGLCLERLAVLQGLPRRTAWIVAPLLSVLLPLTMILRAEPTRTAVAMSVPVPASVIQHESVVAESPASRSSGSVLPTPQSAPRQPARPHRAWRLPQLSDRSLLQAWTSASLLAGLYLLGAHLRLRRRIAGWQHATLLGRPVLISESTGPALVGVFQPRTVIPRWLLDEPVTTQSLILEHERQHIAARDPLLIRAGVVLLAALPWNLPLWWQWRRMRQAIELDCDTRVLRAGAEPETYGEVLLAVTGRATRMPSGVVAMSEPVSALERRIQNLLPDPVRHAALQATGAIALLAAGVAAAVAMDAPAIPGRAPRPTLSAQPVTATTKPAFSPPVTIEAPQLAVLRGTRVLAATAAPAARTVDSAQPPGPALLTTAAVDSGGLSPRDKVLRADGTIFQSSLRAPRQDDTPATYGSGAMAGVINLALDRRAFEKEFEKLEEGPQTAKIQKGQQIADVGTASSDVVVLWGVLPADYDEARALWRPTDSAMGAPAPPQAAMPDDNRSRLDKAMQAVVRKYPELVTGPEKAGFDWLSVAVTKDGRPIYSGILTLSMSPGPAGRDVLGFTTDLFARSVETAIPDKGVGMAKFPKGQPLAGVGKASRNVLAQYLMLPADYDESRDMAKVVAAVREKHTDLMAPDVALVAPEPRRTLNLQYLSNGGVPVLTRDVPASPPPSKDASIINLLTVLMTEDGRIAREVVEQKTVKELQSVYPLPVDESTLTGNTPPYNSFNPPPVPLEAFKVLGLDGAQIGATGYVVVHQAGTSAQPIPTIAPPGVVVRYAWPRRPGEPVGGKAPAN